MTVIIAGERSGVGKTTITLAILAYLKSKGHSLQSFKVGPDYIDPMFHSTITGRSCRNLDPILTSNDYVKWCFNYHSQNSELSIVEGVMGLFDGVPNDISPYYASTAYIAKLLDLAVILIVDCSKLSVSIGAIVSGYLNFAPQVKIVGLILNKVGSEKHLSFLRAGLKNLAIPIMGVWFREHNIELPSRHLGLIPTEEIEERDRLFQRLARLAKESIHWRLLLPYLKTKKALSSVEYFINDKDKYNLKIAIAKDKSFNFYYQDNLDILQYLGVELIEFSPLNDRVLPENINALYLGGGFPELFAPALSQNESLKSEIDRAIKNGLPTYAECGGMMYLSESIVDFQGREWSMVGVLPNRAAMSKKLTLGYREATILVNNNYLQKDLVVRGHEFHHAINSDLPTNPIIKIKDYYSQRKLSGQGWQTNNVYASYLHIHFANIIPQLKRFLQSIII